MSPLPLYQRQLNLRKLARLTIVPKSPSSDNSCTWLPHLPTFHLKSNVLKLLLRYRLSQSTLYNLTIVLQLIPSAKLPKPLINTHTISILIFGDQCFLYSRIVSTCQAHVAQLCNSGCFGCCTAFAVLLVLITRGVGGLGPILSTNSSTTSMYTILSNNE